MHKDPKEFLFWSFEDENQACKNDFDFKPYNCYFHNEKEWEGVYPEKILDTKCG